MQNRKTSIEVIVMQKQIRPREHFARQAGKGAAILCLAGGLLCGAFAASRVERPCYRALYMACANHSDWTSSVAFRPLTRREAIDIAGGMAEVKPGCIATVCESNLIDASCGKTTAGAMNCAELSNATISAMDENNRKRIESKGKMAGTFGGIMAGAVALSIAAYFAARKFIMRGNAQSEAAQVSP